MSTWIITFYDQYTSRVRVVRTQELISDIFMTGLFTTVTGERVPTPNDTHLISIVLDTN